MTISRRQFVGAIGSSAAAAIALPALGASPKADLDAQLSPETGPGATLSLNFNENPYGCAPSVFEVIRATAPRASRYASLEYDSLKQRIGTLHSVKPDQVVLGCGSVEVLQTAADAFLAPGANAIVALPTFGAVASRGKQRGAEIIEVPLAADWSHDLKAMRAKVNEKTGLIYICNPNNPTGSITPRKDIDAFLESLPETAHVLVDEAYHHYVTPSGFYSSFLENPSKNPRLIVVRTFSNVYGLAGLRIGYGITSSEVAAVLQAGQLPQDVNAVAVRAALAALDNKEWVETCVRKNADSRQEFLNQANARMLRVIDSHGNFAMLNLMRPVDSVIEHFAMNRILLGRKFPPLGNYVRVTLGTPDEMLKFWAVLDGMQLDMRM
jgi:histidinol-phosphate aminotransferase